MAIGAAVGAVAFWAGAKTFFVRSWVALLRCPARPVGRPGGHGAKKSGKGSMGTTLFKRVFRGKAFSVSSPASTLLLIEGIMREPAKVVFGLV